MLRDHCARFAPLLVALLAGCRGLGPPRPFPPTRAGQPWRNGLGMAFRYVPAGEFEMGTSEAEAKALLRRFADQGIREDRLAWEQPRHRVRITRGYLVGQFEVTVGQFRRFVQATGYQTEAERTGGASAYDAEADWTWKKRPGTHWAKPGFPQTDRHPVVCVSWNDAQAFAQWLNASDPAKPKGWSYRLPTEAEWELAARGTDRRDYPWGSDWDGRRANFADRRSALPWAHHDVDDGHARTAPVGAFSPRGDSPFGLSDMTGNVWEWCLDAFAADYYRRSPADDPVNTDTPDRRAERGGSWAFTQDNCRAAYRFSVKPGESYDNLGFRIVLAPD